MRCRDFEREPREEGGVRIEMNGGGRVGWTRDLGMAS